MTNVRRFTDVRRKMAVSSVKQNGVAAINV
jgi:hypothetical protein